MVAITAGKEATATDGVAYNGTLLLPTAPKYSKYELPPYFCLQASSESMPASDGEKSGLSAAERRKK